MKELFILFTASAFFRKLMSIYVFSCFPFGFESRMCDLIVSVPGHCLSFFFSNLSDYIPCVEAKLRNFKSQFSFGRGSVELQVPEYFLCGDGTVELQAAVYSLCGSGTAELKII